MDQPVEHAHERRFPRTRESHDDEDFPFADIEARVLYAHSGAGRFEDLFLGLALPEHLAGGVGSFTEYLIDVPCG